MWSVLPVAKNIPPEKNKQISLKKKGNLLLLQYFQRDVTSNISIYSLKFIAVYLISSMPVTDL